ncbi:LysR substrate-binding domain-containing protein [Variovorax sp. J22R133]|uniref:LysR substrate-binding domain-containing protein n=1 Tax=Variovorax brevis TaxID=3053503 RepID=UPI002575F6C2|nr:LysR substrate-binding domain-containing protein [Variovorax sp. J22R133]MDM0116034.1 LysR substrate-binding domain-containing protein [Variovorax sp. J22R133]
MDLRQLRYLIGVGEAGSLLKAAGQLHVAQPALSQHMAALEAELGVQLFTRSSRGMELTSAGRTLLEHARVILSDVERAKSAVRHTGAELIGEVVLGLPTTVALVATLPILAEARRRHPQVMLRLVESHSGYLKEWLQAGRLDLSVLFAMQQEPWLAQRAVLSEKLCLVGSTQGKETALPRQTALKDLQRFPLLLPGRDHGLRRIIDDACLSEGVSLQVIAEVDSLPNIKKAVEAGMAYTILSPGAVADEVAQGRLNASTLKRPTISRTVVCATSLTRPLTPAAAAIVEMVIETVRDLVSTRRWPAVLQ